MVLVDVAGSKRSPYAADRRWQRPGSVATGMHSSIKYCGAL